MNNGENKDAFTVDRNIQGRDLSFPVSDEHEEESVNNVAIAKWWVLQYDRNKIIGREELKRNDIIDRLRN